MDKAEYFQKALKHLFSISRFKKAKKLLAETEIPAFAKLKDKAGTLVFEFSSGRSIRMLFVGLEMHPRKNELMLLMTPCITDPFVKRIHTTGYSIDVIDILFKEPEEVTAQEICNATIFNLVVDFDEYIFELGKKLK